MKSLSTVFGLTGCASFEVFHPHVRRPWFIAFLALLAVSLVLRLVAMQSAPLVPEEAYYWMYAQNPSLSYYDHPPMVAWVISLGTAIFGDTQFGVRIVGSLLMIGASLLMYQFGRIWFGRRAGLLSAAFLQVLPMYFGVGLVATMDSALIFFWLACMVGVTEALKHGRAWGWYLAGFGLGAAMLSKYTGGFLAVGVLAAVVVHRPWRRQLLSPHPYLACLLALAMFSPVILWNAQHDWASFRFQGEARFAEETFRLRYVGTFLAYQALTLTPVLLIVLGWVLVRLVRAPRRMLSARWIIALSFCLPWLLLVGYKSLRYQVQMNWTLPAFLSVLPAMAQLLLARARRRRARALAWTVGGSLALNLVLVMYLVTLQSHAGWPSAMGKWRQLAIVGEQYENQLERETGREPLIIADGKNRLASVLAFYRTTLEHDVRASTFTTSQWLLFGKGLGFEYWTTPQQWAGRDCIYVDEDGNPPDEVKARFKQVDVVHDPRLPASGNGKYVIAICRGYRPVAERSRACD